MLNGTRYFLIFFFFFFLFLVRSPQILSGISTWNLVPGKAGMVKSATPKTRPRSTITCTSVGNAYHEQILDERLGRLTFLVVSLYGYSGKVKVFARVLGPSFSCPTTRIRPIANATPGAMLSSRLRSIWSGGARLRCFSTLGSRFPSTPVKTTPRDGQGRIRAINLSIPFGRSALWNWLFKNPATEGMVQAFGVGLSSGANVQLFFRFHLRARDDRQVRWIWW